MTMNEIKKVTKHTGQDQTQQLQIRRLISSS
jgi:hypothetical protein